MSAVPARFPPSATSAEILRARGEQMREACAAPQPRAGDFSALLATLRDALPEAALVDAHAPAFPFATSGQAAFAIVPEIVPARADFLARFQQAGGALPLFLARDSARAARFGDALDPGRPIVILDSFATEGTGFAGRLAEALARPGDTFLATSRQERGVAGAVTFGLAAPDAPPGGGFALHGPDDLADSFGMRLAETLVAAPPQAGETAAFVLPAFSPPARRDIVAAMLMHDGAYAAERNAEGYSWLWTGPSAHFRILLGAIPAPTARAHVCVINTLDPRNMEGLIVMVDGIRVPHRRDVWSANSGKLIVDFVPHEADMTVLSVIVPHLVQPEPGGRVLGLCIDKVEVFP